MHTLSNFLYVYAQINWAFMKVGTRFAWGVEWGSCFMVRLISKLRGLMTSHDLAQ